MKGTRVYLAAALSCLAYGGCAESGSRTEPTSLVGLTRREIAVKPNVVLISNGFWKNSISHENLTIDGVLFSADFEVSGNSWTNSEDRLICLKPLSTPEIE